MSSTVSSFYSLAMQERTANIYTAGEQHKELSTFRVSRDDADFVTIIAKLENDIVNVHDLFTIGNDVVKNMDSHFIFSYSHKTSLNVKTLASSSAINVADDRTIDPALLFQRFLVVSQTGDLQIGEVMNYELSPYLMSLFEAESIFRQADKLQLAEVIRNYTSPKSDNAVTQRVPRTDHYVLDGGSLLHYLKWMEGCTYSSTADDCT